MVVFIHCPEIYDLKEARKYTGQLHRAKQFSVKLRFFFLSISLNMCFDGSFEYPEHMFWLRNKKKNQISTRYWVIVHVFVVC